MRDEVDQIHRAGAELIVVGNGTPEQAQWFVEDVEMQTPVFTNPERELYRALGARRGILRALHPMVFVRSISALLRGHRQSGVQGDATQLGGVFVVQEDGGLSYAYRSKFAGDHPSPREVLEALGGLD